MDENKRVLIFFFSSRRRHTRYWRDWSSDVCSSDLADAGTFSLFSPRPDCRAAGKLLTEIEGQGVRSKVAPGVREFWQDYEVRPPLDSQPDKVEGASEVVLAVSFADGVLGAGDAHLQILSCRRCSISPSKSSTTPSRVCRSNSPSGPRSRAAPSSSSPNLLTRTRSPRVQLRARQSSRTAPKSAILPNSASRRESREPRSSVRSTSRPSSERSVVTSLPTSPRSSGSRLAFTPTPSTTKSSGRPPPLPALFAATGTLSELDSARMPQIFRQPTSRSLGHLIRTSTPNSRRAFATTTAAACVMRAAISVEIPGRSTSDIQSPPGGEPHRRPRRPLPPVWTSETTSVPWGAPTRASSRARPSLERRSSCHSTFPARGLLRPSISSRLNALPLSPPPPGSSFPQAPGPQPARAGRRLARRPPRRGASVSRGAARGRASQAPPSLRVRPRGARRSYSLPSPGRVPGRRAPPSSRPRRLARSEEHTSELQSRQYLVCRLLLEKKKIPDSSLQKH